MKLPALVEAPLTLGQTVRALLLGFPAVAQRRAEQAEEARWAEIEVQAERAKVKQAQAAQTEAKENPSEGRRGRAAQTRRCHAQAGAQRMAIFLQQRQAQGRRLSRLKAYALIALVVMPVRLSQDCCVPLRW
jgi:hypothetical protein